MTYAPEIPAGSNGVAISNARRWSIVGLLFTASLINYLDRATISFALPLITISLHLAPTSKGLLLSSFFWSYTLMQVPIGWCADHLNLRWLYAGAFALWSLAQGLTGLAGSLGVLIGFRILLGVGESIYLPGGTKIVSIFFKGPERGLPSGLFDFGTRTGLVVEGIFIPWLLVRYGWRRTFVVIGMFALLWLVPWLLVSPSQIRGSSPKQRGNSPTSLRYLLRSLLNRNLLGICLGFFCFDYFWYLMLTWLPDYLVETRHFSITQAGLYAASVYCVFGVSEPVGGWVTDRLIRRGWNETRTRKGIITFAFATGLLLIPAARVASSGLAVFLIMGSSLVGLATANLLVILQNCAPPDEVGIWTGVENFSGNIAGIIAPLATGILISRTRSYFPGFALAVVILISGIAAYWFIIGELEPRPDASS